jgi:hypothetical protein
VRCGRRGPCVDAPVPGLRGQVREMERRGPPDAPILLISSSLLRKDPAQKRPSRRHARRGHARSAVRCGQAAASGRTSHRRRSHPRRRCFATAVRTAPLSKRWGTGPRMAPSRRGIVSRRRRCDFPAVGPRHRGSGGTPPRARSSECVFISWGESSSWPLLL